MAGVNLTCIKVEKPFNLVNRNRKTAIICRILIFVFINHFIQVEYEVLWYNMEFDKLLGLG